MCCVKKEKKWTPTCGSGPGSGMRVTVKDDVMQFYLHFREYFIELCNNSHHDQTWFLELQHSLGLKGGVSVNAMDRR